MKTAHRLYRFALLALTALGLTATPVAAAPFAGLSAAAPPLSVERALSLVAFQQPRDQDRAFRATREGRSMPLPMIERKVRPRMGGADYLGPELRGDTYRLKFMQNGRVIWVDVDAATGKIIERSGQ